MTPPSDNNSSCRYGLIGYPLGHSFSERYFAEKFAAEGIAGCGYAGYPIESIGLLPALIETQRLDGFNVTIPYKQQVLSLLDELDPEAAAVGAVNCVKVSWDRAASATRSGNACAAAGKPTKAVGYRLTGYNTDVYGFRLSLLEFIGERRPQALVLGTGGAAKAVEYVLLSLGIEYLLVSRTADRQAGKPPAAPITQRISYDEVTRE